MSFLKKRNQALLNYPKLCSLNIIGSGGLLQKLFSLVFFFFFFLPLPPSLSLDRFHISQAALKLTQQPSMKMAMNY